MLSTTYVLLSPMGPFPLALLPMSYMHTSPPVVLPARPSHRPRLEILIILGE
jgi:hypothetical protein